MTGKQTLEGHKQNLVHTRTQEKGAVTPQETDPHLAVNVQESLVKAWVMKHVAYGRVGGTECRSACMGPLEGGRHYLHYLHHSLASGQTTGREGDTVQRINRNWSKDLLSMAPPTRTRLSFRLSQSLLSGNFHKPFIL